MSVSASNVRFRLCLASAFLFLSVLPGPGARTAAAQERVWSVEEPGGPTTLLEYTAAEGTWMSVDVAPDGRTILFDLLGHIYEMPAEGGQARRLTEGRSWNLAPRYSPDGSLIAFNSDRSGSFDVWILDRATGELTNISRDEDNVLRPSWSSDGRRVLASAPEGLVAYGLDGEAETVVEQGGVATAVPQGGGVYFEVRGRDLYPFEFNPYVIVAGGSRIDYYDAATGEVNIHIERPGGAFNPAVSPDGRRLAYLNRDLEETVLVLQDLRTRVERVLLRGLDLDRQEGGGFAGPYPNMAWHPDGRRIFVWFDGGIHAVDTATGEARRIAFRAPVRRELTQTLRHRTEIPERTARTRMHRWGSRTQDGIIYEALGDIWLRNGPRVQNLTGSDAHETSPVWDPARRTLYYASWTDDEHGAVYALRPGEGGRPEKLTTVPSQYGSLAVSRDGSRLAYVRGTGGLQRGLWLSNETGFELVVRENGAERLATRISGRELQYANIAAKIPPHVSFGPDGETLYFTEFVRDTLMLKRIGVDGRGERTLYRFPHAVDAVPAPDLEWIALREYHRSFLTPFEDAGEPVTISAFDGQGLTLRIDAEDGGYLAWSRDGETVGWTRGAGFYEKDVDQIIAEDERDGLTAAQKSAPAEAWLRSRVPGSTARRTDLSVELAIHAPETVIALTGVRVITMNPGRDIIEDATVLVRGPRIEALGRNIQIPAGAQVFELPGHTVIPGIVDSHAHPHIEHSALHVIEQRPPYLHGALAYGVTTMFEVYGNEYRDGWLSDMLRAGKITGPRLYTTGSVIYGRRTGRVRMFRPFDTLTGAREQLRWNLDHGAVAVKDYAQSTRKRRHLVTMAARELGLNVLSESSGNPQMNLTQILDGVTGIEHSMGLATFYDDVIRFWGATDAGMTPTLGVVYGGPSGEGWFHQRERLWKDEKLTRFIAPQHLMRLRRTTVMWPEDYWAQTMAEGVRRLYEAGTSIQLGAHGQMMGLATHWELEMLVDGDFTPEQALEIATIRGATYHGLDGSIGSLEPGKLADLVVLRENPLEDIRNSRSIRYVMKHGVVYSGADAARVFPDPAPAGEMYFRARPELSEDQAMRQSLRKLGS